MNDKKKKILEYIFKIVLLIIIIFLLAYNHKLLKDRNAKVPVGNVDIIEIKCDWEDTCKVEPVNEGYSEPIIDNGGSNEENGGYVNVIPNNNQLPSDNSLVPSDNNVTQKDNVVIPDDDENVEEEFEEFSVRDKNVKWNGVTDAKIFTNSMYELEDRIAPESSNTYQFVVKNSTNFNLKYSIEFIENNQYNINMKYKLKKNDTYLIDQYVSADELDIFDVLLDSNTNDTYYLEWKWISSSNDTEIGINTDSKYGLKIEIKAESVNE